MPWLLISAFVRETSCLFSTTVLITLFKTPKASYLITYLIIKAKGHTLTSQKNIYDIARMSSAYIRRWYTTKIKKQRQNEYTARNSQYVECRFRFAVAAVLTASR